MGKEKRLSHEFVAGEMAKAGYTLRSQYHNAHTNMNVVCDRGHEYQSRWSRFRDGSRCPHCNNEKKRLTHEFVEGEIAKAGYTLRSQYQNSCAKLEISCDRGHEYKVSWSTWSNMKSRCPHCSGRVLTHETVQAHIESFGYRLNTRYKNNSTHLSLSCPNGHEYKASWATFYNNKRRCPHCYGRYISHEYVANYMESFGYSLESQYRNSAEKLNVKCDCDHLYQTRWDTFKAGGRCPSCAHYGFNPSQPATIYYLRFLIDGCLFYKIGITNRTIQSRFQCEPLPFVVVWQSSFLFGFLAREEEARILKKHKKYLYKGSPVLVSGNTELFTKDVLKLDRLPSRRATSASVQVDMSVCGILP